MAAKPTVPEVLPLVWAYYAKEGNGTGGSLHIVLEDENIEDHHVRFCLQWARDHNDPDGIALAELLLRMSHTQRKELSRRAYG